MPHLDEGTLHALLDGELELDEVKEIQTHLGGCSACGSRLQDVKQFLAEADRLVGAIEAPASAPRARREPAPPPPSPIPPPHTNEPWREPVWDSAPQILLPDDLEDVSRRRRWGRRLRWAAMILVVLGAGQMVRSVLTPGHPELELSERDLTSARPASPPPVVSPEERSKPESTTVKAARPASPSRPAPARAAPEPKVLAEQSVTDTAAVDELDTVGAASQAGDTTDLASKDSAPSLAAGAIAAGAVAAADRPDTEDPATERPSPTADAATRRAAAAALEELDRERLRARANAATASLPPARTEPVPAAQAAPPAPRTLEQRAQIYLRIGLDEAVKQLGQPMHVIEAMSPEFIGLSQGRIVPGFDPARPVVRVVYRDTRGRMILLDQQRMQSGQSAGAAGGNLRWAVGDVLLYLHGEPGADVLRTLQRRVR